MTTRRRPFVPSILTLAAAFVALALIGLPAGSVPAADSVAPAAEAAPSARPAAMVPLYFSLAALEAADVWSTYALLPAGGREANPLLAPVIGSPIATSALKAGTAAAFVLAIEHLRTAHPKISMALLTAVNGYVATAVSHNYVLLSRQRSTH
jgi:hypothetical protein